MGLSIHAAILACAWAGGSATGWWLAPLAALVVAALQHHLLTLVHEGAHGLVHPDRRINDVLTDLLGAIPAFTLTRHYPAYHFQHHRWNGRDEDPEVVYYRGQHPSLWADFFLVNWARTVAHYGRAIRALARKTPSLAWGLRDAVLFAVVWGGAGLASWRLGFLAELIVFWVLVPILVLFPITKIRSRAEHEAGVGPASDYDRTRSNDLSLLEEFFFFPLASGYHLEHHLFPRVPWYRIRQLRERLSKDVAHVVRSIGVTHRSVFA
jgi:fatty acid desaturase